MPEGDPTGVLVRALPKGVHVLHSSCLSLNSSRFSLSSRITSVSDGVACAVRIPEVPTEVLRDVIGIGLDLRAEL